MIFVIAYFHIGKSLNSIRTNNSYNYELSNKIRSVGELFDVDISGDAFNE